MNHHKFERLVYSSKGGFFESYLCVTKSSNIMLKGPKKRSRNKVLQSIKVTRDILGEAQERLNKMQGFDENKVEPMLDAFHSASQVFIVTNFIG